MKPSCCSTLWIAICLHLASALTLTAVSLGAVHAEHSQPNIIIYLADDLGYGSVQPFGADPALVQTANISALAERGVTLTNAYTTASVCSPTRYGLLTGRYSWRTWLKRGVINNLDPLLIEPGRQTIGSWLQQRGYRTAHIGKWHLGYKATRNEDFLLGQLKPGPNDVGFTYSFAVPNNLGDRHNIYTENDRIWGLRSDSMRPTGSNENGAKLYGYDAPQRVAKDVMPITTHKAVDWILNNESKQPFFLYFCAVAVHDPIEPSDAAQGTSDAGPYGDFIHDVDLSLGKITAAVKQIGQLDNTIILFTSDNGADILSTRFATDPTSRPQDIAIASGLKLNGDLRGDKHTIWEGGFKVPTVISWPTQFPANTTSDAFVTTVDFFATISDLVAATVPEPQVAAPDSISFAHVLRDPQAASHRKTGVFRDVNGRKALYLDNWKYLDDHNPSTEHDQRIYAKELYDLDADPSELQDIAQAHPQVLIQAHKLLKNIITAPSSRTLCSQVD